MIGWNCRLLISETNQKLPQIALFSHSNYAIHVLLQKCWFHWIYESRVVLIHSGLGGWVELVKWRTHRHKGDPTTDFEDIFLHKFLRIFLHKFLLTSKDLICRDEVTMDWRVLGLFMYLISLVWKQDLGLRSKAKMWREQFKKQVDIQTSQKYKQGKRRVREPLNRGHWWILRLLLYKE